ncbi:hypothetical protein D3C73_1470800 [compost metagenome]
MRIDFDLARNDAEALLRHCGEHVPRSGDVREDARLRDALQELKEAICAALGEGGSAGLCSTSTL